MPCTFTGSLQGDEAYFAKEALDAQERMLCALCSELERNFGEAATRSILFSAEQNANGVRGGEIQEWWVSHKKADAKKRTRNVGTRENHVGTHKK